MAAAIAAVCVAIAFSAAGQAVWKVASAPTRLALGVESSITGPVGRRPADSSAVESDDKVAVVESSADAFSRN
jgi:hypothetical protein